MKKLLYFILSLIVIILFSGPIAGQDKDYKPIKDPTELIRNINQFSLNNQSIKSDFGQVKRLNFLEEDVLSSGKFYFKKENLLRWEYTEPFQFLIIFKEDKIMVGSDDQASTYQISGNKMFEEINQIMLGVVNGTILESESFLVEYFSGDDNYLLKLIPQEESIGDFLNEIHLYLDKSDYSVNKLIMLEKSGDFTKIIFANKVLNEDLPDHIFGID
jgi:outer membrane lipoprotein-sorting protein